MPRQGRRGLHTECPHVACLGYICIYVSSWFGSVLHVLIGAVFICIIRASHAIINRPWTRCPSDLEYDKHVHTIFFIAKSPNRHEKHRFCNVRASSSLRHALHGFNILRNFLHIQRRKHNRHLKHDVHFQHRYGHTSSFW